MNDDYGLNLASLSAHLNSHSYVKLALNTLNIYVLS